MAKPSFQRPIASTLALGFLAALTGCGARSTPAEQPAPPITLQAYSVPPGYAQELRSTVRQVLEGIGRAEIGPGGQLLVTGPPLVQAGVQQLVRQLEQQPPPPPPTPVTLTYWIIAGRPQAAPVHTGASALPVHPGDGYSVTGYDMLADAAPALREIAASQGPTDFMLIERLRLSSIGDQRARTSGAIATVQQRAAALADGIVAEIQLQFPGRGYSLETEARLVAGHFLVLGQSGYRSDLGPKLDGASLYYVVASDAR